MAKRFTDTAIWLDEWFMNLPPDYKLAFIFIKDNCDAAGIWKPNKRLANMMIGCEIDWNDFLIECGDRVKIIKSDYWWITKFVEFQYGCLSEKCKPHLKVIEILKRYDLLDRVCKGYTKGLQTFEEKEEEKDKEKDKEKKRMSDLKIEDCKLPKDHPEYQVMESSIKLYSGFCQNVDNRNLKSTAVIDWVPFVRTLMIGNEYSYDQIVKVAKYAFDEKFWKTKVVDMKSLATHFEKIKLQYLEV